MEPGSQLGHYEILSALGKGGMGEVWRARDTTLGREVAIKTLPEEFASDADRLARFEREAKLLASLNHPNIAAIHGFEEDNGTHFIVLELVEGDTLDDRLRRGAIPVTESLQIALQIAEALEAAHENGVIHRDLKPGNIKVRKDGTVKVLDFGLAKAFGPETSDANVSNSPTLSMQMTQQGVILGTAAYMSPEQAQGLEVDNRTDIWAFGCVLYEMLTGRTVFEGSNASLILARVLERGPEFTSLPVNLHPGVRDSLERCLEKEAKDRWHHVADIRVGLQKALADPDGATSGPVPGPVRPMWQSVASLISVAVVAASIGAVAVWTFRPVPASSAVHLPIALPAALQLAGLETTSPFAISPDGSLIVFVADRNGTEQLFIQQVGSSEEPRPIPGTGQAVGPFFHPDGRSVGFFSDTELKTVLIAGGAPKVITAVINSRGGSWSSDGQIIFADGSGLQRISDSGDTNREPLTVVDSDAGETFHRYPHLLPGDETVIFTIGSRGSWDTAMIVAERLDTGVRTSLINGSDARYVPTGHLVYRREGALWAVAFDPDRLEVSGNPVLVVEGIKESGQITGAAFVGVSRNDAGTLVYLPGTFQVSDRRLLWADRAGDVELLELGPRPYSSLDLSHDETRLAVEVDEGIEQQIWMHDLARPNSFEPLTTETEGIGNQMPRWTPDDSRISFRLRKAGLANQFLKSAIGAGVAEPLTTGESIMWRSTWSLDEQYVVLDVDNNSDYDIYLLDLDQGNEPIPLFQTPDREWYAAISPDSRWLAHQSTRSGSGEIVVTSFPDVEQRTVQISDGGAEWKSVWSRDGTELFYMNGNRMMAVPFGSGSELDPGTPRELFPIPFPVAQGFDYSADRDSFLLVQTGDEQTRTDQFRIILNWFQELTEQVPVE